MFNHIYPSEFQLNKADVSDTEASFLDLHLSISDDFVKTKIVDKRDDFGFDIVTFPFLDGDVPGPTFYGVYIYQLIRFAQVSKHVDDFNTRNKVLTAKRLRQGYRFINFIRRFKIYRRHFDLVSIHNVRLKTLLLQGLSVPEFNGDLVIITDPVFITDRPKAVFSLRFHLFYVRCSSVFKMFNLNSSMCNIL